MRLNNFTFLDAESSVTPEKIIDLLKKLSPAKLQDIKTQMFNKTSFFADEKSVEAEKTPDNVSVKMELDEASTSVSTEALPEEKDQEPKEKEEESVKDQSDQQTASPDDDCIILIDSDDEPEAENNKPEAVNPEEPKQSVLKPVDNDNDRQSKALPATTITSKRKSDESKENQNQKVLKKTKECVNPDCSHDSEDFFESPMFILNFYYTARKWNKTQYVCSNCYEKAVDKYEVS